MRILFWIIPLGIILTDCSSFMRSTEPLTPEQLTWITAYQQAKTLSADKPSDACNTFLNLSKNDDFLLKDLALLRAHLVCAKPETLATIAPDFITNKPWLQSLNAQRLMREATFSKNFKELNSAYIEMAKRSAKPREKTNFLLTALKYARRTHNIKRIHDTLERLYRTSPRLQKNPDSKDWMRVAQDYLQQRNFRMARRYFMKITMGTKSTLDEKYLAYRQYRNSYKLEQDKEFHIKVARKFVTWNKKFKNYPRISEAYITLIRAMWTEGYMKPARQMIQQAILSMKGHYPLFDLYLIRGRMSEEEHAYKVALDNYKLAELETTDKDYSKEKILFYQAWMLRKLGSYAAAATKFSELQNISEDSYAKIRYMFWESRSLEQADQKGASEDLLHKVIQADPIGFYGLVSYYKLGIPIPPLKNAKDDSLDPASGRLIDINTQRMIRALVLSDEKDTVDKFISLKTAPLKNQDFNTDFNTDTWLFIFKNLAAAGLYQPLFSQLGNLPLEIKTSLLDEHPELLFPRRYLDLIEPAANKFGVEPEFILSIIRQESSFDPLARSSADAFGLMQVIPPVAQLHERNAGLHLQHQEDLFIPQNNIPIGTSLLAELLRKYNGQLLLTAAAYNANEKAIAGWLNTRLSDDPLEFIEDIPYEETRNYVKLVIRNYIFYRRMARPGESTTFPASCLENLKSVRDSINSVSF